MENQGEIFFVQVPLNDKGIEEWKTFDLEFNNAMHFEFTEKETTYLDGLFYLYNEKFNLLIDEWEDEEMAAKDVPTALEMAKQYAKEHLDETYRPAMNRFIEALELAHKLKMPVYFDF